MTIDNHAQPDSAAEGELVLVAPKPIARVSQGTASRLVKLEPDVEAEVRARADEFVRTLCLLDVHGAEFTAKVDSLRTLGQEDIRKAAHSSNRMLDLPMRAMESGGLGQGSGVSTSLVELRRTVEDLDPSRQGIVSTAQRKLLGVIPMGNRVRNYFAKYSSGQKNLNAVIEALLRGQDELRKDNAGIEQEKSNLWATMHRLRQYALLAEHVDAALVERIEAAEATDSEMAMTLRSDVQFQVRQKLQDLMTQLAVSVQGYLAMDLVRKNNLELIKGVDRATTTTVSALRTAVIVAQALSNQKLVLNQITALNTTTSNLIESTSVMLREQTGEIYNQAAGATVNLEKLQAAFQNVYAAMDSIDSYKVQAVETMRHTVDALTAEVDRAQKYLDRTSATAAAEDPNVKLP